LRRLDAWCDVTGITTGSLFRPLGNARMTSRLGEGDVARIFRRRSKAAGIDTAAIGAGTRLAATQQARRLEVATNARALRRTA
jgi:hypothetical protein